MRLSFVTSTLALALATTVAYAADDKPAPEKPREDSASVAGVKVAVDPATGKFRPLTAEEAQQVGAAMRKKLAEIRSRAAARRAGPPEAPARATSAHRSAVVATSHLRLSVVNVAPDGTLDSRCVPLQDGGAAAVPPSKDRE